MPNYWDLLEDGIGKQLERSRKMFLRGGRFSGKSFWAAHHIVMSLLALAAVHKEGEPWACCLALRKYSNTLKTSVYAEIANAIINLGVEDKFQMLTNPMEIRLKGTKSVIKFANLNTAEDYGKVKSIKWPGGYCRLIWFEESDQFQSKHDVDQVLLSLYRGGDIFETIFTYNTPFSPSHWLNVGWRNEREMMSEGRHEKVYFKHVNLYDIPKGIVPEQVYEMAEAMREENLQEWKHVIMGEVGDPATMVFPNIKAVRAKDLDLEKDWVLGSAGNWRWFVGMDYGYRPDPTVCVVAGYNKIKKILWNKPDRNKRSPFVSTPSSGSRYNRSSLICRRSLGISIFNDAKNSSVSSDNAQDFPDVLPIRFSFTASVSALLQNRAIKCPSPAILCGHKRIVFFSSSLPFSIHSGCPQSNPS